MVISMRSQIIPCRMMRRLSSHAWSKQRSRLEFLELINGLLAAGRAAKFAFPLM
jgi:hypothetical protein